MAPKKDKKPVVETKQESVTEVERTLWNLETADLNRKLARLRASIVEYEVQNEELQRAYDKLDEDRADIIAYLKKTLNVKTEENIEMKEKIKGLEELREIETAQFKETVNELEKNFNTMKDQLTSENRLLTGKLNTLEEFRAVRDEMMKKFEAQEQAAHNLEMKYKRIIYETEKKFIIGKDRLKKEMEGKLLELAQSFQDASELRIAASTHRTLRENIALNNQLDSLLMTQAKVADQNEKYKESERMARVAMEAAEEERDAAINKSIVQLKVIDQLTASIQNMKKDKAIQDKKSFDFQELSDKNLYLTKHNESLLLKVRILEQNLHCNLNNQTKSIVENSKIAKERDWYKKILKDAAFAVQAAFKLDNWCELDPKRELVERKHMLNKILDVIMQYRIIERSESLETVVSLSNVYEKGDLGFVPKDLRKKSKKSFTAISTHSKESIKDRPSRSSSAVSVSSSSIGSVKTIPSVQLVPQSSQPIMVPVDSLPSFTVTSLHSSVSLSEEMESEEELTDMEKKLAFSKLEIQKSIMKDLAYSQMALASQAKFEEARKSKSVVLADEKDDISVDEEEVAEQKKSEMMDEAEIKDTDGPDAPDKEANEDQDQEAK